MTSDPIAVALQKEHRLVTRLMVEINEQIVRLPSQVSTEWLEDLKRMFGRFRVHMKNHMDAEEVDGFMAPVLERRPTLWREVEHLRHEHVEMAKLFDEVFSELQAVEPEQRLLLADTCHRIQHLISAIEHHEEHEELLVTFVFSQDLGAND